MYVHDSYPPTEAVVRWPPGRQDQAGLGHPVPHPAGHPPATSTMPPDTSLRMSHDGGTPTAGS